MNRTIRHTLVAVAVALLGLAWSWRCAAEESPAKTGQKAAPGDAKVPQWNDELAAPSKWKELAGQWKCPEWIQDAKFGLWLHWGPQSVPEYGGVRTHTSQPSALLAKGTHHDQA